MSSSQDYPQGRERRVDKDGILNPEGMGDQMHRTKMSVAENFLRMLSGPNVSTAGYYVRLAYKYGVPIGRIISLTGISAARVISWVEEAE